MPRFVAGRVVAAVWLAMPVAGSVSRPIAKVVTKPGVLARQSQADTLRWRMMTTDEHPIAGMTVRVPQEGGTATTFTTDSAGWVTVVLPVGQTAIAEAPGTRIAYIAYTDEAGSPPPRVAKFRLPPVIHGMVTDTQNRPVAGATVDVDTLLSRDSALTVQRPPIVRTTTDDRGQFTIAPRALFTTQGYMDYSDPLTLVVMTGAPRRGAIVPLAIRLQGDSAVHVTVVPLRPVRVTVASAPGFLPERSELEVLPSDTTVLMYGWWVPRRLMHLPLRATSGGNWRAVVDLPVGTQYRVNLPAREEPFVKNVFVHYPTFAVPAGRDTLVLHRLDPPTAAQRFANDVPGAPVPELSATTLDGAPARLADYRGKVVVLDFWGFWCKPCVAKMPLLARIANAYRDSNVVVLTIHDASIRSGSDYRTRYAATVAKKIGGPSALIDLLDTPSKTGARSASGQTIATYHVTGFPTTLVIDPRGRLVGYAPTLMKTLVDTAGHYTVEAPERDPLLEGLIRKALGRTP